MKVMRDKARAKTDKKLKILETNISEIYEKNLAIITIEKEYARYMADVKKHTDVAYKAYIEEEDKDIKAEKKAAYQNELKRYTLDSKKYNKLVKKIVSILALVNQQALDIVNDAMVDIYTINYNQVAEDCKKVGIKVNG